jgi:exodeoxyribonuclease VII large subunit
MSADDLDDVWGDDEDEDESEDEADGELTYSVTEFLDEVQGVLTRELRGAWVQGEIADFKPTRSGHTYFSLIEEDDEGRRCVLNVNYWRGKQAQLTPKLARYGLVLADGLQVRLRCTPNIYKVRGSFSVSLDDIDPRHSLGELLGKRDALLRKLREEGVFDLNRQLEFPRVPLHIALVTSRGTAAHADVMKTFIQSQIGFRIFEYDVRVQGDEAPEMVAGAIRAASLRDDIDVVMVVRGGGAKNELATFDDERIAVAIARCAHPVVTGIGHEIDLSVADEVAYEHHKTPTFCAVALIRRVEEYLAEVNETWSRIAREATDSLDIALAELDTTSASLRSAVLGALGASERRMAVNVEKLRRAGARRLEQATALLDTHAARVRLLDPQTMLGRGWSITTDASGRAVRDVARLTTGDVLTTRVANGTVTSTVTQTTEGTSTESNAELNAGSSEEQRANRV